MATIRTLYNKGGVELYPRTEVKAIVDFTEGFKKTATELNIIDKTTLLNTLAGYLKIGNTTYYTKVDTDNLLSEYSKSTAIENNYTKLSVYNEFTNNIATNYLKKSELSSRVNILDKWNDYYTQEQTRELINSTVTQKIVDITTSGSISLEGYLKIADFKNTLLNDFKSGQNSTLWKILNDETYNSELKTTIKDIIVDEILEVNKNSNGGYSTRAEVSALSSNNSNKFTTLDDNISTLQNNLSIAQTNISTLQENVRTINTALSSLETNYLTASEAESTYATIVDYVSNNDLNTKVSTTQTILNLITRIESLESSIQSLTELLTALDRRVTALETEGGN